MLIIKPIKSREVWEGFLLKNPQANFLQSWNWGQFHQNLGKKIFRLGFFADNQLQGIALLIKVKAKRGTYLECPGGPIIDWSQSAHLQAFINHLKNFSQTENISFVRLRPNILDTPENRQIFKTSSFVKALMHILALTPFVLDLDKSE